MTMVSASPRRLVVERLPLDGAVPMSPSQLCHSVITERRHFMTIHCRR
jgi:hypothetical protein